MGSQQHLKTNEQLAVQVSGFASTVDGETPHYRNAKSPHELLSSYHGCTTLYESFRYGAANNRNRKCLGRRRKSKEGTYKHYEWSSYGEVLGAADSIASGLVHLGVMTGDFVGILATHNRAEWVILDQACNRQTFVMVPVYGNLGSEALAFIINDARLRTLFLSIEDSPKLLSCLDRCPSLRLIVLLDGPTPNAQQHSWANHSKIQVVSFLELQEKGERHPIDSSPPQPDDLAVLCYTSGTTGTPKGVKLIHRSLVASMAGILEAVPITCDDVHLSYLPLAHVLERLIQACMLHVGAGIGFCQGDSSKLLQDLKELKPTIFVSVPKVYRQLYDALLTPIMASNLAARLLFDYAYAAKLELVRNGKFTHPFWDKVVFEKSRDLMGGRVRRLFSGAAPLDAEVKYFMQICFCCPLIEGYGLTETAAVATIATPEMSLSNTCVGAPIACCEMKLIDLPEFNFTSKDKPFPRGEVCLRGPNLFRGYYRLEEATAEALDAEGWLHTGDIGCFYPDGTLGIIDRKRDIIRLSQGVYVSPQRVEQVCLKARDIYQILVHGDTSRSCVVALVVPNRQVLGRDGPVLAAKGVLSSTLLAVITRVCHQWGLKSWEVPRAVHVLDQPFETENLLTPTLKVRRQTILTKYADDIKALYAGLIASGVENESSTQGQQTAENVSSSL